MKKQEIKANYAYIQQRKKEIEGELETLMPQSYHNPRKSIQESVTEFGENAKKRILDGYLEAALWADGEEGEFDEKSITDIAPESIVKAKEDIEKFLKLAADEVYEATWGDFLSGEGALTQDQIGHDIWLTRQGHGSGFWDRNLGELGDQLTTAAEKLGQAHIYTGDDGMVYIESSSLEESGLGAVANWAGNSLGRWGQKQADKLAKTGQKVANKISQTGQNIATNAKNTANTAKSKYQAGQRAANINKIKKQKDTQYTANKERLIQIKQQIDSLAQQYKQITGKTYKGGAIANPVREDSQEFTIFDEPLSLNEVIEDYMKETPEDDFLDAILAKNMAAADIGDDFIDPYDRGDMEDFKAGIEGANDIDDDSEEMKIAKRNHLARIQKMKMDKLSELKDLEEDMTASQFDSAFNNNPKYGDVKKKLIQRFMNQDHPVLVDKNNEDVKVRVRMSNPSYVLNSYILGTNKKMFNRHNGQPLEKSYTDNIIEKDIPNGTITLKVRFEGVYTYKDENPQILEVETEVYLDTNSGKSLIKMELTNSELLPLDRRNAVQIVKQLRPALEKPLTDFGKNISSGKDGGFSEINRNTLKRAKEMIGQLKPNNFYH